VEAVSHSAFPVRTFYVTPVRTLTTVSSVALLWLLSVSFADAAQTRHKTEAQPCDAQSTTLKKLARHSRSWADLAGSSRPARSSADRTTPRLQRATRATLTATKAAIQNDAPAARSDADERPIPTLHPLGLLIGSLDIPPLSRAFSPRSLAAHPSPDSSSFSTVGVGGDSESR